MRAAFSLLRQPAPNCNVRPLTGVKNTMQIPATQDSIRNFFKRWPAFYYFVATVFGPMMFTGISAQLFLRRFPKWW